MTALHVVPAAPDTARLPGLTAGDRVRVRGRRGVWELGEPIDGGWWVFDPDQRGHAIRENDIRKVKA